MRISDWIQTCALPILPPHLLRAPRRNLFFPAEFILTMPVLADDSLERARFHALLDEARRCRACVGLLPFEPARSFRYRRWRAWSDRKRTRLNSSPYCAPRMPSSA